MTEQNSCSEAAAQEMASGHIHGHIHGQIEEHFHGHFHGQICPRFHNGDGQEISSRAAHGTDNGVNPLPTGNAEPAQHKKSAILTLRCHTGISGDMLLCGLASLIFAARRIKPDSSEADQWLGQAAGTIMAELADSVVLRKQEISGISGWQAHVKLPVQHTHRTLEDIKTIIENAGMLDQAKHISLDCFELLARCEASVHDTDPARIHFHEIGALDSILDICLTSELYVRLREPEIVCSPLPLADGEINCAHGCLPAPAPAVLQLLSGMAVRPFRGGEDAGELVTPTGIALLRALKAGFGPWPEFYVDYTSLIYGQRAFPDTANGLILALGHS